MKSLSSVVSMSIFKQDIRVAHEVLPSSIERYSWRVLVLNCLISANSSSLEVSVCVTNNWVNFISSSTAPGYWKEIWKEFEMRFNPVPLTTSNVKKRFFLLKPHVSCKGCTREFLYIRNSNPRLKLALLAEKCAAGMHVNTHSCPLRTEKLTKFHRFLSRLTLTSEGGEWIKKKPRRDFCHLICTWQGRRGWNKRILKQLNCYWQNQKQGSCFRCFFFQESWQFGKSSSLLFLRFNPLFFMLNTS